MQVGEDERRHLLPRDTLLVRVGERPLDQRLDVVEAVLGGAAEQDRGVTAELPVRMRDLGRFFGRLNAGDGRPAVRRIEERRSSVR